MYVDCHCGRFGVDDLLERRHHLIRPGSLLLCRLLLLRQLGLQRLDGTSRLLHGCPERLPLLGRQQDHARRDRQLRLVLRQVLRHGVDRCLEIHHGDPRAASARSAGGCGVVRGAAIATLAQCPAPSSAATPASPLAAAASAADNKHGIVLVL